MDRKSDSAPAADMALYKLYHVKIQPPAPGETKPHPYQSFDAEVFIKSKKNPGSVQEKSENSKENQLPETSPSNFQGMFVTELESRKDESVQPSCGFVDLMQKLKLSDHDKPVLGAASPENAIVEAGVSKKAEGVNGAMQKLKLPGDSINLAAAKKVEVVSELKSPTKTPAETKTPVDWILVQFKSESIVLAKHKRYRRQCVRCVWCRVDIDLDETKIRAHIASEEHLNEKLQAGRIATLRLLPQIIQTGPHTEKLSELLSDVERSHVIPPDKRKLNQSLLVKYQEFVSSKDPEKSLLLTGSMAHGIGLIDSDVNFLLKVPLGRSAFQEINELKEILLGSSFVENLRLEPTGVLHFLDRPSAQKVTVTIFTECHNGITLVLIEYAEYMQKYNRTAWEVVLCFRYWANVCGLDRKDDGMMYGYMFVIIAISILQGLMVLPVLAEMKSRKQKHIANWKAKQDLTAGELWRLFWLKLENFSFKTYAFSINSLRLPKRDEKGWGKKRLAVESPGDPNMNLCREIPCSTVYDRFTDLIRGSAWYFCTPQIHSGPLFHLLQNSVRPQPKQRFRKFSDHRNDASRKRGDSVQEMKTSESEKSDRKSSDSVSSEDADQRIDNIASCEGLASSEEEKKGIEIMFHDEVDAEYRSVSDLKKVKYLHIETETCDRIVAENDDNSSEEEDDNEEEEEDSDDECLEGACVGGDGIITMSVEHATREIKNMQPNDFLYRFDEIVLLENKKLLSLCTLCKSSGHNSVSCPEVRLPPVIPLPPMTPEYFYNLERALYNECHRLKPSKDELTKRSKAIMGIRMVVRQRFMNADIQPFGSCNNGFGCAHSDLDLCLTFKNNPTGEDVDGVKIVTQLAAHLRRSRDFVQVTAISSAKVPIVKAYYVPYEVEVDISVYNTLGIYNTRLLYTYASLDERVQNLGYLAKSWAKACDIGDASKGTLSSYAYILMVLFYAQRCNPPLIPNLQEIYSGDSLQSPQRLIAGWNTWFFEPNPQLPLRAVWPGHGKNTDPLSVHWINFLSFYSELFDWSNFVVSIRQSAHLPKMDKNWTGRELCIEDPFNLDHNLAGALTLKMAQHVKTVIIESREHFGFPVNQLPPRCGSWPEYFWHPRFLVRSRPPNDRPGCFICGCVRHKRNECPKRFSSVQKNDYSEKKRPPRSAKYNGNGAKPSDIDGVGSKYQPKVNSRFSASDSSQLPDSHEKKRTWKKYPPSIKDKGEDSPKKENKKNGAEQRENEEWPTLPTSSSPSRGGEPLRDSSFSNRPSKKVDLGRLQSAVFGAISKVTNRTNKKQRNLSTGDSRDFGD